MEVQAVDVDDIRRILEGSLNVAIFPDTVPDSVRGGFLVEDAVIGEGLLHVDYRLERFVLDLNEFGGIVGQAGRLRDYRGNRLSLVEGFADGHGEIANLLRLVRTDLDEGLRLRGYLFAGDRAYHAGQRFGCGGVDADDARVRKGRANEAEVKHFAKLEIVGEFAPASQQAVLFLAGKRRAYPFSAAVLFLIFSHVLVASANLPGQECPRCTLLPPQTFRGRGSPRHTS